MTNHQLSFTSEVLTNVLSMHFAWIHFLMASNNIHWRGNSKMLNLQIQSQTNISKILWRLINFYISLSHRNTLKQYDIIFILDPFNNNCLMYIWFLMKSKTNIWFRIKHVLAIHINVVYDLTYVVCLWLQICRSYKPREEGEV